MKGWIVKGEREAQMSEFSQNLTANTVKVKMFSGGLSLSDIRAYFGESKIPEGNAIGKIGSGMVTEIDDAVKSFSRGDRVVVCPYNACGECYKCKEGHADNCANLSVSGNSEMGLLRDYVVVSPDRLVKIPDKISYEEAGFIDYVATAVNVLDQIDANKGEFLLIAGAGVLGTIIAQVAIYYQMIPVIIDTDDKKLDYARDLGIYYAINTTTEDVYKKIYSITGGKLVEAMVQVGSSGTALSDNLVCLAFNGSVVLAGDSYYFSKIKIDAEQIASQHLVVKAVTNGYKSYHTAVNLIANNSVAVKPFVTEHIPFDMVGEKLAELSPNKSEECMKLVIDIA